MGLFFGKMPTENAFPPLLGKLGFIRPACFGWVKNSFQTKCPRHLLNHVCFLNWTIQPQYQCIGEKTLVPGCFSAVHLSKCHFTEVVVVWQSVRWVQCRLILGSFHLQGLFFPSLSFLFFWVG